MLADLTVVDADSHVDESVDDLIPYVENSAIRRTIERAGDTKREILKMTRPTPPFPTTKSGTNRGQTFGGSDLVHERGPRPETKQAYMDEFDIDYAVVTAGETFGIATVNHDQVAVEIARAYNEFLSTDYLEALDTDRIKANILISHHHPDTAAEEIDAWADDDRFAAIQFPASGLIPPAGHHSYDPIFEVAEKNDLPLILHSGAASASPTFPVQRAWAQTFVEDHLLTFPFEAMWHFASLLFRGIPERFPDLSFVLVEAGMEWVPWMRWRMDDHYLQSSQDVPILTKPPSDYVTDQFYFTTQPLGHHQDASHLSSIIDAAGGADTVLFASDHPHADFDLPKELYNPLSAHLDDEAVEGILGGTAIDLFGFE